MSDYLKAASDLTSHVRSVSPEEELGSLGSGTVKTRKSVFQGSSSTSSTSSSSTSSSSSSSLSSTTA